MPCIAVRVCSSDTVVAMKLTDYCRTDEAPYDVSEGLWASAKGPSQIDDKPPLSSIMGPYIPRE